MSDAENILLNDDELNEDQLMNYLKGNLPDEEAHKVEERMADSSFVSDAVEGLQAFSSEKKLDEYVQQLNKNLHKQTSIQKQKNEKRKIKDLQWIILSVIIILLLCLLGYVVINMLKEKENKQKFPVTNTSMIVVKKDIIDS